jgi:hydrogenase maturation protease
MTPVMTANEILVIGYGNALRSDDAAGPRVAESVEESRWSGVRGLACHQLTPELADAIASARAVIFVDASCVSASERVRVEPLEAGSQSETLAHTADPSSLLALARAAFGRCPPAWRVGIPAGNLDFGEGLSPRAELGVDRALDEIRRLCAALADARSD